MGLWKGLKAACSNPKPKGLSAKGSNFSQPSAEEESTSYPTNPVYQVPQTDSYNRQPAGVKVDFDTNGLEHAKYHTQQEPEPDSPVQSLAQQPSQEGFLGANGVYVPHTGFRTSTLLRQMREKYDIPEAEIRKAMEFAESAEYVDVYCFTYCITGGPMEPTAYKVAGLQGMEKEAILESTGAPGSEVRALNPEEQARHDKAKRDFLVERALNNDDDYEPPPEDLEELTEAYRVRFEEDTSNMSLDEVMIYFGVPEAKTVAIHKALHPAKGAATASLDEKARRKAAHAVALERYNELS